MGFKPSIIVPIRVESEVFRIYLRHLWFCLEAVHAQTVPYEGVLVDFNSAPQYVDRIRNCGTKYGFKYLRVVDDSVTFSRGRAINAGVKASTGDVVFFLDSDCIIPPNYVKVHLASVKPMRPTFSPFYDTTQNIKKSGVYKHLAQQKKAIIGLRPNSYSHVSIHKAWIAKHGAFDPAYVGWGAEDDDIMLRMKRSGSKPTRIPTFPIHLWHPEWKILMRKDGKGALEKQTLKLNRRRFWAYKETGKKGK